MECTTCGKMVSLNDALRCRQVNCPTKAAIQEQAFSTNSASVFPSTVDDENKDAALDSAEGNATEVSGSETTEVANGEGETSAQENTVTVLSASGEELQVADSAESTDLGVAGAGVEDTSAMTGDVFIDGVGAEEVADSTDGMSAADYAAQAGQGNDSSKKKRR